MKTLALIAIIVFTGNAYATYPTKPDPVGSHSESSSNAAAVGLGTARATGGDSSAIAAGGAGGRGGDGGAGGAGGSGYGGNADSHSSQQQSATGGQANNAGNSLEVNTHVQRSAPGVGQGGLFVGDCGAGANGGGSNTNGAAFLGFAWTPGDCKLLKAAAAYQALGMYDAACEMVNGISAVKARWKTLKMTPPDCAIRQAQFYDNNAPAREAPPAAVDLSEYVKRDELAEREKRIVERTTRK